MRRAPATIVVLALALLAGCGGDGDGGSRQPLVLDVTAPRDGSVVARSAVRVRGRVTPDAYVSVNGRPADERAGRFALTIDATPGLNTVTVAASKDGYDPASRRISFRAPQRSAPTRADRRATDLRIFLEQNFGGALETGVEAPWYRYLVLEDTLVGRGGSVTVATTLPPGARRSRGQARSICRAALSFDSSKYAGKVAVLARDRSKVAGC
jgi:hypothetical protein